MAITHAAFLTQVRDYTEVDSNVLSDSKIQDFIRSVELDVAGKVDYGKKVTTVENFSRGGGAAIRGTGFKGVF